MLRSACLRTGGIFFVFWLVILFKKWSQSGARSIFSISTSTLTSAHHVEPVSWLNDLPAWGMLRRQFLLAPSLRHAAAAFVCGSSGTGCRDFCFAVGFWAATSGSRKDKERKKKLRKGKRKGRQTYYEKRSYPTSNYIFKQELCCFQEISLGSRRHEWPSSQTPGLKRIDAKTDEKPLNRYCM